MVIPIAVPLPPGVKPGVNVSVDAMAFKLGEFLAVKESIEGRAKLTLAHPNRRPTVDEAVAAIDALYPDLALSMGIPIPPRGKRRFKPNTLELIEIGRPAPGPQVVDHKGKVIGKEVRR